jgi:signal peptidase I
VLVLLGYFLLQAVLTAALGTTTPLHTPISKSMEPTLKIGDLLIIQGGLRGEDVYANLGNGDIIIFKDPRNPDGIPIVHRAIEKYMQDGTWYIITKGDNNLTNPHPDNWYPWFPRGGNPETAWYPKAGHPETYIIGKVIIIIPYLGYAFRLLDEPIFFVGSYAITARVVLIVTLIAAFIYLELKDLNEEKEKTLENNNKKVYTSTTPLTIN